MNKEALKEIVRLFQNPKVGCVAGEKRIAEKSKDNAASGGEGLYWKYESTLKSLDWRLYSAAGAAGELFAIRRCLFEEMETDTLLDDFILSMRIVMNGYRIAYCASAYAIEGGSADMIEEEKRKVRIAAGGLQEAVGEICDKGRNDQVEVCQAVVCSEVFCAVERCCKCRCHRWT